MHVENTDVMRLITAGWRRGIQSSDSLERQTYLILMKKNFNNGPVAQLDQSNNLLNCGSQIRVLPGSPFIFVYISQFVLEIDKYKNNKNYNLQRRIEQSGYAPTADSGSRVVVYDINAYVYIALSNSYIA